MQVLSSIFDHGWHYTPKCSLSILKVSSVLRSTILSSMFRCSRANVVLRSSIFPPTCCSRWYSSWGVFLAVLTHDRSCAPKFPCRLVSSQVLCSNFSFRLSEPHMMSNSEIVHAVVQQYIFSCFRFPAITWYELHIRCVQLVHMVDATLQGFPLIGLPLKWLGQGLFLSL